MEDTPLTATPPRDWHTARDRPPGPGSRSGNSAPQAEPLAPDQVILDALPVEMSYIIHTSDPSQTAFSNVEVQYLSIAILHHPIAPVKDATPIDGLQISNHLSPNWEMGSQ